MDKVNRWAAEIAILHQWFSETEMLHNIKWGSDVYSVGKRNVLGIAGFKNFFAIWFFEGHLLADHQEVLVNAQEGKTKFLRQWRFTDIAELDKNTVMAYVFEAIENAKTKPKTI